MKYFSVEDLDLEQRPGGGGVVLLALPAFLPSMISSFLPQIKGWDRVCLRPLS